MAPEQAGGRPDAVGPHTDVWALGAILYELLTGRPPFDGVTTLALLRSIEEDDPPSPRTLRPGLPAGLAAVCLKCLRKRPDDRYAAAADLAADLTAWREGRSVSARPFGWRDRLAAWLRRPQRVRDAAVVATTWNGIVAAGLGVLALDAWLGWGSPLPHDDAFLGQAVVGNAAHVVMAALAFRMLRGDRWAWWGTAAAAVASWLYAVGGWVLGGGAIFSIYDRLPEAKFLVMLTITCGLTVQLALVLLSFPARPRGDAAPGRRAVG